MNRTIPILLTSIVLFSSAWASAQTRIPYRERILNVDGTINWREWEYIARNFHTEQALQWRLGPTANELNFIPATPPPTIPQPDPQGLWKGGLDASLANAFCVTSDRLPRSEAEEARLQDGGGGWQLSGQLLFAPQPSAPPEFRFGAANMRAFDGAMARKFNARGELETRALCMRLRAEWTPDWWNRNNISTPTTPVVARLKQAIPDLPLPPVATARGDIQASITGFLAFSNGVIAWAGTGNDPYCGGFGGNTACESFLRLPPGKIPTALAVTGLNEFLFATVWDVNTRRGQLAVIAVGPEDPANIGPQHTGRYGWGVQSWPLIRGLKLLGFVDLPMSAPNSLSVSISAGGEKFRGFEDWHENLNIQSVRDRWHARNCPVVMYPDCLRTDIWKQLARAGYAIVASRAENRVAFVDLRPLLSYYRRMYLTTESNWVQTSNANQGPGPNQWPYTFDFAPEQRPRVVSTLRINQPSAVIARKLTEGTSARSGYFGDPWHERFYQAWVASMDGTVQLFDVRSLVDDRFTPQVSTTPRRTIRVGLNPVQIAEPIKGSSPNDDLFVVSRASREIHVFTYRGESLGVLRDSRLVDPVAITIGPNGGGYGGAGAGYAFWARVLTILDYNGQQVHDYGMHIPGGDAEQWPYRNPTTGQIDPFQHGFTNRLPGKPFQYSFDEVI